MNFYFLLDNPFFIKNWRERMRPHYVGTACVILVFIIGLIFLGNYTFGEAQGLYDPISHLQVHVSWWRSALYQIVSLQGTLLLLLGTIDCYRAAAQERAAGVLDFHRASPFPRKDQALGLLLGGAVLEWSLFFLTLPIVLILALIAGVSLWAIAVFYASFILTTLFFHLIALWAGISVAPRKNGLGIFGFLFLFYFISMLFSGLMAAGQSASVLRCATWFPAYDQLHQAVFGVHSFFGVTWNYAAKGQVALKTLFFGCAITDGVLQLLVQIPLGLLFFAGIMRRLSSDEITGFSKPQTVAAYFLIAFYLVGSIDYGSPVTWAFPVIMIFSYFFTLFAALIVTPDHLGYVKGLSRAKKLQKKGLALDEDQNSNWLWFVAFSVVTIALWGVYARISPPARVESVCLALAVVLLQTATFVNGLEWFNLSRFYQKRIFLWTAAAIVWVGIPFLNFIAVGMQDKSEVLRWSFALSPFFTVGGMIGDFFAKESAGRQWMPFLVVNALTAIIAAVAAYHQRKLLQKDIFS
ncbi:MAG: hypothetical protein HQL18_04315 [Candidatus Omnitrophica bacterium]|nr:hypothetical protein [Candidatus Omnitrophota bacterium]